MVARDGPSYWITGFHGGKMPDSRRKDPAPHQQAPVDKPSKQELDEIKGDSTGKIRRWLSLADRMMQSTPTEEEKEQSASEDKRKRGTGSTG